MIPLRLELKNFMSYGENVPALDFGGMHTLCLSGENGNGKSALLDAITWSLWGESRAGSNRHEDLVRLGADEMSVEFTFEMDSQTFRVLRKYSKRASGRLWELQQADGAGAWRSLSGNKSAETGHAIQKLLRMSYDTFLNSAYLRQGHADQFVRQTPGKRKEILADILDLSRYDKLESLARERSKDAAADATDLSRDLHSLDEQLSAEPAHHDALNLLNARRAELTEIKDALHAEWLELARRRQEIKTLKDAADTLQAQRTELARELSELDAQAAADAAECEQHRALIADADAITAAHDAFLETQKQLADLDAALARWHKGQQQMALAEREWQSAEHRVRTAADLAAREHDAALHRVKDHPQLQREHDKLAPHVAAADALDTQRQETLTVRTARESRFNDLREQSAVLDAEMKQWRARLSALAQQTGACQVCNSPLPPDQIAAVTHEYESNIDELMSRLKAVRIEAGALKEEITALKQREANHDAQIKAAQSDGVRLGQLSQQILALDEIQKDIPNLAALRAETARVLAQKDFAPELQARIITLQTHLAKLTGVEQQHADARARLASFSHAEKDYVGLQYARSALRDAEARLSRTAKTLTQRRESLAAMETQLAALPDVSAELSRLTTRDMEIRAHEKARAAEEQTISQEIGSHEAALKHLDALKSTRADKEKRLADAKREEEVHKRLMEAFGKKGVQALIIENAIPELQEEANRLLEKLTDGDMTLYFDTLREAKTKRDSPIETLDIKVCDSLGTRPLEMYSGGEGFRAAFAIRIALSKLLARRAGAKLQTLIIDEGFGTQDGKGREKLVDALNAIGSEFERIIVITHIDELKDAFASRVEVTKTPAGSYITISEGDAG